jgi:CubicO group peptidase (beta-lactamase class C family)
MNKLRSIIVCILLLAAFVSSANAQVIASSKSSVENDEQLDTFLEEQSKNGFSGSVLLVRKNKIVLNKTYGKAAESGNNPVFWIASNSKSFVAAAILKLQEQGKLSVNDPLSKFFKDVPDDKQQITVHHLLAHTSGLPHKYAADGIAEREKAVQAILTLPLQWKVGEGYHYSNDGYNLLAAIVEIASNRTFEDYLRKNILKPAGLDNIGFWGYEEKTAIVPVASILNTQNARPTIYKNGKSVANWGYRGATGIYAAPADLYRWMLALQQDKVLTAKSREQMWGKQSLQSRISPGEEQFYGYGWGVRFKVGKKIYMRHSGYEDWLGHSGVMCLYENGDAYVVLSNAVQGETTWSSIVSRELQKRLQASN